MMPKAKSETALRIPCEVYSRVVGYLRPVKDWNPGKRQEFAERVPYDLEAAATHKDAEQW